MGLFSRFNSTAPPTAINVIEDNAHIPSALDLEKHHTGTSTLETVPGTQNQNGRPDVEKRVIRKMDFRIVPLVTALYVLAFLDRSNIGNAKIAGMEEDLHLEGNRYQWLLTIFYITYILFEWQALMVGRLS